MATSHYQRQSDPPIDYQPVTLTGDTTGLVDVRGLYIGVSGNVAVATFLNPTVKQTIPNVPVGILPGRFVTVYSSSNGTTASSIFAIY